MDLLGAGLGLFDSLFNAGQQNRSQSVANDFSAQQFATRYQTTVADMQAAGLSPMLAYSQGASGAPSGAVGSGGNSNVAGASAQYRMASAQEANLQADTDLKRKQSDAVDSKVRQDFLEWQTRDKLATQSGVDLQNKIDAGTYLASADASRGAAALSQNQATELGQRIEEGGAKAAVDLLRQQFEEAKKRTGNIQAATDQIRANIQLIDANRIGATFDNSKKEAFSDFFRTEIGKNSPMAEFLMSMGKDVSDMILGWKKFGVSKSPTKTVDIRTHDKDTGVSTSDKTVYPAYGQ